MQGKTPKSRPGTKSVSVSELGSFGGDCEVQALLRYRDRVGTCHVTQESLEGEAIHAQVARDAVAYEHSRRRKGVSRDTRCYIATAVFGVDAPETEILRVWRDQVLMKSPAGRAFIAIYYAVSPLLVRGIPRQSLVERGIQAVLRAMINKIRAADAKRSG